MVASHTPLAGTLHADPTETQEPALAVMRQCTQKTSMLWYEKLRRSGLLAERYQSWEQQGLRSRRNSSSRSGTVSDAGLGGN